MEQAIHGIVVLGATPGAGSDGSDGAVIWISVGAAVVMLVFVFLANIKTRRRTDMLIEEQRRGNAQSQAHLERDQKAYAQHVALNELTAEKIKLENQYLQLQMKIGALEIESRERADEYHGLMSDKTRLEIQSLKLHIREQTKRLDDYSGYGDD